MRVRKRKGQTRSELIKGVGQYKYSGWRFSVCSIWSFEAAVRLKYFYPLHSMSDAWPGKLDSVCYGNAQTILRTIILEI